MAGFASLQLGARAPSKAGPGAIGSRGGPGRGPCEGHKLGDVTWASPRTRTAALWLTCWGFWERDVRMTGSEVDHVRATWPAAGLAGRGPEPAGRCVCAGTGGLGGWRPHAGSRGSQPQPGACLPHPGGDRRTGGKGLRLLHPSLGQVCTGLCVFPEVVRGRGGQGGGADREGSAHTVRILVTRPESRET